MTPSECHVTQRWTKERGKETCHLINLTHPRLTQTTVRKPFLWMPRSTASRRWEGKQGKERREKGTSSYTYKGKDALGGVIPNCITVVPQGFSLWVRPFPGPQESPAREPFILPVFWRSPLNYSVNYYKRIELVSSSLRQVLSGLVS